MPKDEKSADTWLWFRQMFEESAGPHHPMSTPVMWALGDVQSCLGDAMTYQQKTQGRINNNLVDSFPPYLIHSDKNWAPIGLCWQAGVKTMIMSSHKNVTCKERNIYFSTPACLRRVLTCVWNNIWILWVCFWCEMLSINLSHFYFLQIIHCKVRRVNPRRCESKWWSQSLYSHSTNPLWASSKLPHILAMLLAGVLQQMSSLSACHFLRNI